MKLGLTNHLMLNIHCTVAYLFQDLFELKCVFFHVFSVDENEK